MALKASFSFISADLSKSFALGHGRQLLSIAAIPSEGAERHCDSHFTGHGNHSNFLRVLSEQRSFLFFFFFPFHFS